MCPIVAQVLAKAIGKGCADPVNDYLKMTNKKKVTIRDINPKSVSTQELYGFVNMATREWKVRWLGVLRCAAVPPGIVPGQRFALAVCILLDIR